MENGGQHGSTAMRSIVLIAVASLLAAVGPYADAGKPAPTSLEIEKWITDLASDNFGTRDRATKQLRALKEGAIEPLKDALCLPKKDLEFVRRVQSLLDELIMFERDGETVNGLRLFLAASNDTLRVG